jgi:hypothetical protein
MDLNTSIPAVSSIIQLALAPVFLLTGIAGFLSMLSLRLGRVVDRGRLLDRRISLTREEEQRKPLLEEANVIWKRIRIINWAIRLAVLSALTICLVVVCLFAGGFVSFKLGGIIAYLFVAAMFFMVICLVLLLFEVTISTSKMRQGLEHLLSEAEDPDGK